MTEQTTIIEPLVMHGDSLDFLREIPDDTIDVIVTDPPYGLSNTNPEQVSETILRWAQGETEYVPHKRGGFMGKDWDSFVPPPAVWVECLRILKPGGHLLTFAGTRTMDLMTLGLRLAGFDIRDSLAWLYGSGFPKSLDVSKAIDKAQGIEGGRGPMKRGGERLLNQTVDGAREGNGTWGDESGRDAYTYAPGGDDAKRWQGWGTALKPAFEPIVMARKPFKGTVAATVLAHGTGALNIDACRVSMSDEDADFIRRTARPNTSGQSHTGDVMNRPATPTVNVNPAGRWPANVVLGHTEDCEPVGTREIRTDGHHPAARGAGGLSTSGHSGQADLVERGGKETIEAWNCAPGCQVAELDAQSGTLKSGKAAKGGHKRSEANMDEAAEGGRVYGGSKGIAGTSSTDDAGVLYGDSGGASRFFYCAKASTRERPVIVGEDGKRTVHPTVKPLALMRWLIRLVTPPGGLVLDPFVGSGTTIEAGMLEGFEVWGIEGDEDYLPLIQQRVDRVMAEVS